MNNLPVEFLDLVQFSGKWFSLYSIPTVIDRNWKKTIEYYSLVSDGYFEVFTTYHKDDSPIPKSIKSKLFFDQSHPNGELKAQFIWPFKIGYRIIELDKEYQYVVVGHPKKKYLFIMSRLRKMESSLLEAIVSRCRAAGYATERLVDQQHSTVL